MKFRAGPIPFGKSREPAEYPYGYLEAFCDTVGAMDTNR